MCGIIGFNWEDKLLLKSCLREIQHRGPDGEGAYLDEKVSLGHRRLAIIDLSSNGKQPMSNEKGDIWIVFNGEIYNFQEIKKSLRKVHQFKSNTDTEILLHLYEEYGVEMLSKLQGMFAFCIYDTKKKIFFLARDRVGIKPLYYYNKDKDFMFCSEIKGILVNKEIKPVFNQGALEPYLCFRANTEEETFFKGIKKLMPGSFMIYDLKTNTSKVNKFWEVNLSEGKKGFNEYSKELYNVMNDSVKDILISDVPYGAFLSGGVDSGIVTALMSKYSSSKVNTFSVGFEKESELKDAKFMADNIGTNHHELIVKENSVTELPDIVRQFDEPVADPTIIPTYFLSRYTKKFCSVVLTGEGSDEIFAGYPQYKFMKLHKSLIRRVPLPIRKSTKNFVDVIPLKVKDKFFKFSSRLGEKGNERLKNFLSSNDPSYQYFNQVAIFNEEEQSDLLKKKVNLYKKYEGYFNDKRIVTSCQNIEFSKPMVDDLLMKVDKSTMAFGLEARVPFLDHRVVELGFNIPSKFKLKGIAKDKFILRQTFKDVVPKQVKNRKKRHFFVPIDGWFKNELNSLREEILSKRKIEKQNIFNYNYLSKIGKEFNKSRLFYSRQLWSILIFQIWYKQYIENERIKI